MRKARWALLAALVAAIAAVVAGYYVTQQRNLVLAPARPAPLPAELGAVANNWSWSQTSKDRPVVEARARGFRQIKDSSRFELDQIELKIYSKSGETYDWVQSNKAQFDQPAERLYSEGEVTIVLGLPARGERPPGKRYVEIRTSGLVYDNKTGISSTDRPAQFQFEDGEGRSTGASYDSGQRYLWMKNDAEVTNRAGVRIRAGELHYWEAEQRVELKPWSSVERDGQGVRAAASTVYLEQGKLKRIEAQQGQGWNRSPGREVRFGGEQLEVDFTEQKTVERASGIGQAELISKSASGVTSVTGKRIDLEFVTPPGAAESQLSTAGVSEKARVESAPGAQPGRPQPETRVLTAEFVKLTMMPGGEDVRSVETASAGRLELLPQQPGQWKRALTAERISARYAPGNRLEVLRAFGKAHLRSDPSAGARGAVPRLSWSDDLEAFFDLETGQMRELRQWSNFRYQEGARQARAAGARFDIPDDRVYLDDGARVWDGITQTEATFMVLNQKEDRFQAEGRVTSSHAPKEGRPAAGEALFSSDRPVHAVAARMDSEQGNRVVRYRGRARLWQEGSSVQAEEIDLDRAAKALVARRGVLSVLVEEDKKAKKPRLIRVAADSLEYSDENRRAYYRGNVVLERDHMTVRSSELEAFLRPAGQTGSGESRLERAVASGQVQIVESGGGRRAAAEQAEYFADEEKVVLRGGTPTIEQTGRGFTRGAELTYFLNDDRLLVSGRPGAPSESRQKIKRN